jgi:hypothetical protein
MKERLVGLVGPRGVGKTTLMLQYIRERVSDPEEAFYASAAHIYFNKVGLLEFVQNLFTREGTRLFFFDEVHKYEQGPARNQRSWRLADGRRQSRNGNGEGQGFS